ncbi:Threonine synthase-like 1 [Perkinsus chesapeaki]|uniref:Threonine synthase-like 1 n=1 Tax=Perkinsus chesapeaki TaxID=330153 RepID=A0A7J6MT58_PERCH|nr:Threonine synthase-like 1 [Perkinsus chesapeaki]
MPAALGRRRHRVRRKDGELRSTTVTLLTLLSCYIGTSTLLFAAGFQDLAEMSVPTQLSTVGSLRGRLTAPRVITPPKLPPYSPPLFGVWAVSAVSGVLLLSAAFGRSGGASRFARPLAAVAFLVNIVVGIIGGVLPFLRCASLVLKLAKWSLSLSSFLTWLFTLGLVSPEMPLAWKLYAGAGALTQPLLATLRKVLPSAAMTDIPFTFLWLIVDSAAHFAQSWISRAVLGGMFYKSTRGKDTHVSFVDAVLQGLGSDGGLLIPEYVPKISPKEWEEWRKLGYRPLACRVLRKFISPEEISDEELQKLVEDAYGNFRESELTPVRRVGKQYVLELFHGPTFAFKDMALQLLGGLFELCLERKNKELLILGATSGDTGSAAIAGVKGRKNIKCKELQMTTTADDNIHCLAVKGNFDDCQNIVKSIMSSPLKEQLSIGAVNSINWARILAQIVYYAYATARVQEKENCRLVDFVVPTGNFGDILAGYYCRMMGAPIDRLVIASNQNDILPRFFETGTYSYHDEVIPSLSPSMDIAISSNFERFLFYLFKGDTKRLNEKINDLKTKKAFSVTSEELSRARKEFSAYCIDEESTKKCIAKVFRDAGYLLCPHSAVGYAAGERFLHDRASSKNPVVSLATAHVSKFVEPLQASYREKGGASPELMKALSNCMPAELKRLYALPSRRTVIENSMDDVKEYLVHNFSKRSCCCCPNSYGAAAAAVVAGLAIVAGAIVIMKRR